MANSLNDSDRRTLAFLGSQIVALPLIVGALHVVHQVWTWAQVMTGGVLPLWLGHAMGFITFMVIYVGIGYATAAWLRGKCPAAM